MRVPHGLRAALAGQTGAATDPNFSNVSLLMYGDGANGSTTFVDSSSNNFAITPYGNAQISTTQSKFGGASMYFDGDGDHLTVPYNAAFVLGSGDFTVEGWFYFSNINTNQRGLVALGDGANGTGPVTNSWSLQYLGSEGSNQLSFTRYDGSTLLLYTTSGASVTANTWHHIAVCRASGTLRIFLNGVSYYTASNSVNFSAVNTSNPLRVALQYYGPAYGYGGPRYWNGYIDDLRITKGVARYTANFTPPTASFSTLTPGEPYFYNTSLLLHGDGTNGSTTFVDSSSNNFTITPYGNAQISTTQSKFGGASMYFDGNGDYLTTPVDADFSLGTNDFTIECWVYRASDSPVYSILVQMSNNSDDYSALFGFAASSNFVIYLSSTGASWDIASGQLLGSIENNTWVHYALTRSGSTFRTFKNGVQQSSWSSSASVYQASNQARIGYGQSHATTYFKGYIDDLRITKGVARYTANFTPPTEPFPDL